MRRHDAGDRRARARDEHAGLPRWDRVLGSGVSSLGAMDSWSFRLANRLAGNPPGAAALECQFLGPTIRFHNDTVTAITGADMDPRLDGEPVPMWESVAVRAGQELALTFARTERGPTSRSREASRRRRGSARARRSTRRASAAWAGMP